MKYLPSVFLAIVAASACSGVSAQKLPAQAASTASDNRRGGELTIVYQSNLLGEIEPCG